MSTDPLKALLTEIQNVEKRRIKPALTWEALGQKIQDAANGGKPLEEDSVAGGAQPPPVMLPDWPKLKVRWDAKGLAQEYLVLANPQEEAPYHGGGWLTAWPPNSLRQIQGLGQGESLESHVEKLKADGIKERPKQDWERRKESSTK